MRSHIIPEVVCLNLISEGAVVKNLENDSINFTNGYGSFDTPDDLKVLKANIMARDGVIHVIDTVLIPEKGNCILNKIL